MSNVWWIVQVWFLKEWFFWLRGTVEHAYKVTLKQVSWGSSKKILGSDGSSDWMFLCHIIFHLFHQRTRWNYSMERETKLSVNDRWLISILKLRFCENVTLDFSYVVSVKSKVEILQNFVAFSEYMNFKRVSFTLCVYFVCNVVSKIVCLTWGVLKVN